MKWQAKRKKRWLNLGYTEVAKALQAGYIWRGNSYSEEQEKWVVFYWDGKGEAEAGLRAGSRAGVLDSSLFQIPVEIVNKKAGYAFWNCEMSKLEIQT